ncbi:aldo/keto reductase [Nostoc sp.]
MRRYHKLFHRNYDIGTVSDLEKGYDIVEVLHEMANNRGVSVAQVALNWLLRQSGITSVIIGARNEQQLRDNLGAAQWELTLFGSKSAQSG